MLGLASALAEGSYHVPRWERPRAQPAWGQDGP